MIQFNNLKDLFNWNGIDNREVRVNEQTILGSAAVWYCINTISGDVGKMPLEPRRVTSNGRGSEPDYNNAGWSLMRDESNGFQTSDVFKEMIQGQALAWGNGRAAIVRDGNRPSELIPLLPDRTFTRMVEGQKLHITTPQIYDDPSYPLTIMDQFDRTLTVPDGSVVIADADVLHIQGFGWNGFEGMSIADVARDSLGIELRAQRYTNKGLNKGFAGQILLQDTANVLRDEDQAQQFLKNFRERHNMSKDSEAVGLLRQGMEAQVLNMSNRDAQFLEQRKFNRQDVMLWFGMQHIPGDDTATSYNSLEQKQRAYLASCLDRWLVRWEMQCDAKLRTPAEKASNSIYYKFNRSTWLATDAATTQTVLSGYIASEVISPNEARQIIDMNPRDGGDVYANPAINPTSNRDNDNGASALVGHFIGIESERLLAAASTDNFLDWVETFYARWSVTFANALSEHISADEILEHTVAHKQQVIEAAGRAHNADELKNELWNLTIQWQG
jgi:HK97 family phage portal protein